MKSVLAILLTTASTALIACQGQEPRYIETKVPVVIDENSKVINADNDPNNRTFSVKTDTQYKDNTLSVNITPTYEDLRIIQVKRTDNVITEQSGTLTITNSSKVKDMIPTDASDLRPWDLTYEVVLAHPSFEEARTVTFKVVQKKDLTVEGSKNLDDFLINSSELNLRNVVLERGSVLSLNFRTIRLNAESFQSENARIETSSVDQSLIPAGDTQPGRDSGDVVFDLGKATGSVLFEMRSGKGGKGQRGDASSAKGATGASGTDEKYFFEPIVRHGRDVLKAPAAANGTWRYICVGRPTSGSQGGQGGKGGSGRQGARGGNNGRLEIQIGEGNLRYTVKQEPGLGGDGGEGGVGGPGGDGGAPGKSGVCKANVTRGAQGAQGPQGDVGETGIMGGYGSVCVRGPKTFYSCQNAISLEGTL